MPKKYMLRFARIVILEKPFEAEGNHDANNAAWDMEMEGKLTISPIEISPEADAQGIRVVDVQDYDSIWEVKTQ